MERKWVRLVSTPDETNSNSRSRSRSRSRPGSELKDYSPRRKRSVVVMQQVAVMWLIVTAWI